MRDGKVRGPAGTRPGLLGTPGLVFSERILAERNTPGMKAGACDAAA